MDYLRLIGVPLAAGAFVYALWLVAGRATPGRGSLGRALAGVAGGVALAAMVVVCALAVRTYMSPPEAREPCVLADLGPVSLVVGLRMDALSGLTVVAASGIALLVIVYSLAALAGTDRRPVFYAWTLWTVSAVIAAALAETFFVLLVAWESATILLYLLIGLGRPEGKAAGMKTLVMLGFADVCLLLGMALLVGRGRLGPDLALAGPIETDSADTVVAYLLVIAAALAKAGAMPLHTWIPASSEEAPTPVFALLPAALDKLLGIYLLARATFGIFSTSAALADVLMVIGAATILCAVMMAMIQHNLKRLLAMHAVSQVGYMVLGMGVAASVLAAGRSAGAVTDAQRAVATIAFAGGLLHMLNNSIYKCALFLMAGSVERLTGTTDLDRLGGLARTMPVTFLCSVAAAMAISGVPPMNGFVSKWLVYHGALGAGSGLALACLVAAVFGSALTLASFVKVVHSVFLGTRGSAVPGDCLRREHLLMTVPMVVLAGACVVLGVGGGWAVERLILPAADAVGMQPAGLETAAGSLSLAGGKGFWEPTSATLLVLLGAAAGLVVYLVGRAMPIRIVPNFVGGEDDSSDARWHVSGTGFYETIARLPGLGAAMEDASVGAFDVYRLTGRYGVGLVERLRGWHTGLLAAYASWAMVGLVILVIALVLR